ncbi:hypothetical protein [Nocardia tenerifensis]|uniref:hypothetical protein n=1 Tax=Nocardia tenerifensis TaxID=228006 RepID=UPI0012F6DE2C|nr:hypothetical protein [Nocardia tenerifensis]
MPAVAGAHKADGIGVHGTSSTGFGVRGDGEGPGAAVVGVNNSATPGNGGWFESAEGEGVRGWSKNPNHGGVVGVNTGGGNGGFFESAEGEGVRGWSKNPNHGAVVGVNTGGGDAGNFQGNVYVTGNITVRGDLLLEGADYAEALSTTDAAVEAGLVVVLGADGEVHPCTSDYDTAVAGIVSGAGGVKPAIVLDRHDNSAHVALMGKVWCAADADMAPIRPGDLLTTSATSGHCRRVTEPERAFGAVIGKALTSLSSGQGYVRVLVSPR